MTGLLIFLAAIGILSLAGLAAILLVLMGDREQDIGPLPDADDPTTLNVQNGIGD